MSLTTADYRECFIPLFGFVGAHKETEEKFIASFSIKFGWMNKYQVMELGKALPDELDSSRFPVPKKIRAVYELLSERQGWRNKEQTGPKCERCGGTRWLDCYKKANGMVYPAVYPCPKCNTIQLEIKTEREPATKEEFLEQRRINQEEYVAREEARRRQAPMLPATDYEMSPVAKQAVQNKAVIHDEIKPLEKALQGALTAPAPVKAYEEEVF